MTTSVFVRMALLMALIALVSGCGGGGGSDTSSTATVTGVVWDVGEAQSLEGVTVAVGGEPGTTNAEGQFSITQVPTGSQPLSVSKTGYEVVGSLPNTVPVQAPTTNLALIYMIESVFTPPPGPPPPGP